jgi:histidinol-phosphate phosphatase family protein
MRVQAVLFDRDGTLVVNVPYNGDPGQVVPMPTARQALDSLRAHAISIAVVSNQSGVGRGMIDIGQVHAVNRRVEELLGPVQGWFICPHAPEDDCACRKPSPALILQAAAALDVSPAQCVVIGDRHHDLEAAQAAGARGILVPGADTTPAEVAAAPEHAPTLLAAVQRVFDA